MIAGRHLPGLDAAPGAALGEGVPAVVSGAAESGVPAAVQISFLVTGLFLVGWMVWAVRQYQRTGQATWLWLGALMAIGLVSSFARYPR